MTRYEEIQKEAERYAYENMWYPGETSYESDIIAMTDSFAKAFKDGAEWADKHPKLHWIDVRKDLPYNHPHLMVTEYATVNVFVLRKGGSAGVNSMVNRNGKWEWDAWRENYTHWMPIPSV